MKVVEWLVQSVKKLEEEHIATARLDCLVLLEDAVGKERSYILAHDDMELDAKTIQKLDKQIARRAGHEPLAYIRGKSEFYGRTFLVNQHTLQPRPETETMLTLLRELVESKQLTADSCIADIGTGSGCIAITAKLEFPKMLVLATDISDSALKIAKKNAAQLKADVAFYKTNLLENLPALSSQLSAVLCNLPYVPNDFTINQAAMQEPKIAIFGGVDGLDYYRELFQQIKDFKPAPRYILTESLPFQHHGLATIARRYGYTLEKTDDFIQLFKIEDLPASKKVRVPANRQ